MALRDDMPPRGGTRPVDAWLRRDLSGRFDAILREPVPEAWIALFERGE